MTWNHALDENASIQDCAQSINRMLGACNTSHTTCKASDLQQISKGLVTPQFIPKRLLHVSSGDVPLRVRLLETISGETSSKGLDLRYTALSHCWGSTSVMRTTDDTISGFKTEGISWACLSRTLQEAILLTRDLDINYIWIDSLCKYLLNSRHVVDCTKFPHCGRHLTRLCARLGRPSFSDGRNILECLPHDRCIRS